MMGSGRSQYWDRFSRLSRSLSKHFIVCGISVCPHGAVASVGVLESAGSWAAGGGGRGTAPWI